MKTVSHFNDQITFLIPNITAALNSSRAMKAYSPGLMGKTTGPMIVALGHGLPDTYGAGPDLPGTVGACCWFCCCLGTSPCSPPAGSGVGKMKADFNDSIKPTKGVGMDRS